MPSLAALNPHATPFTMPLPADGPNPQQLPISFLNVCSLTRKVTEVQQLITSRGIKLMCLAKTWLNSNVDDGEVSIPHFAIHRRDRGQRGGGVAIYSHDSLLVRRCTELESEHLEVIWLKYCKTGSRICAVAATDPRRNLLRTGTFLKQTWSEWWGGLQSL